MDDITNPIGEYLDERKCLVIALTCKRWRAVVYLFAYKNNKSEQSKPKQTLIRSMKVNEMMIGWVE